MSDWLKRDPENGMLIGPDGCHYHNEHQACHYGLLKLCGCGRPEDAFNFCRAAISVFDRRGFHDTQLTRDWVDAEHLLSELIAKHLVIVSTEFECDVVLEEVELTGGEAMVLIKELSEAVSETESSKRTVSNSRVSPAENSHRFEKRLGGDDELARRTSAVVDVDHRCGCGVADPFRA